MLDKDPIVGAWAKNHRLYLEIPYLYLGTSFRYRPDFIVRLTNGEIVLLEGKGDPDEKDDAKATAARRWVEAVNTWGGLGHWTHIICYRAQDLSDQLEQVEAQPVSSLSIAEQIGEFSLGDKL